MLRKESEEYAQACEQKYELHRNEILEQQEEAIQSILKEKETEVKEAVENQRMAVD